jgi:hypothetical protein
MSAAGQLDFDGNEQLDPRAERVAKALWWNDAKRTWAIDGNDIAKERARTVWPTVQKHYLATARVVLAALDA